MLIDPPGEAAWNMAFDRALLELAEPPTLRLYGWRPHAVSLGYFQSPDEFADLPRGTPLVRRDTGGGAIHHGDELTFALAVDAERLPRDVAASYVAIHDAVVRALVDGGIRCQRVVAGGGPTARPTQRWCFAEAGRDDIVTDRGKLCGSAQRRVRKPSARVLHHGSLVLRRPALTPFAAAVADQRDPSDAWLDELRDRLAAELARVFGTVAVSGQATEAERARAAELAR